MGVTFAVLSGAADAARGALLLSGPLRGGLQRSRPCRPSSTGGVHRQGGPRRVTVLTNGSAPRHFRAMPLCYRFARALRLRERPLGRLEHRGDGRTMPRNRASHGIRGVRLFCGVSEHLGEVT